VDPFLSLPVTMTFMFFLGFVIQKYLLNHIVRGSIFITLTFTFGLQILLANICLLIWKADFRSIHVPYAGIGIEVGPVVMPLVRLGIFIAAMVLTLLFYLFLRKTKTGVAINATALNFEGAKTVGVDVMQIYAITYGVGAALAAAAGSLLIPVMSVNPFLGADLVQRVFIISVLGGLGSPLGALLGGLLLGLVETTSTVFISSSYQELVGFAVFLLVLIFRPQGLTGKRFF
jgi:branched-chain amino acid transport system permease protein